MFIANIKQFKMPRQNWKYINNTFMKTCHEEKQNLKYILD